MSFSISVPTESILFFAKARITRSDPEGNLESCGEMAWRTLRAKAWRVTDPPTDLFMINPHFGRS